MDLASTAVRPLNNPDFMPTGNEASSTAAEAPPDGAEFWGEDGMTFADFLDIINPLHHLPIIGSIYRAITGDEISPAARIAGGALFGGPLGLAGAVVNAAIDETTGKDLGEHAVALFTDDAEDAGTTAPAAAAAAATMPDPAIAAVVTTATPPPPAPPPVITQARRMPIPAATATVPAASAAPRLSPAAFDLLIREFNGPAVAPAVAPALRPPALAERHPLPEVRGAEAEERRRIQLELHRLLAERHTAPAARELAPAP